MDKSYVLFVIFFFLILLIVISYTINESEKKLLNEIEKLRREVQDDFKSIENDLYTLQSIIDCGKKDELLFKVAQWAISVNGLSTSAVQRHFNVSYIRAKKIVEQLYSLGVIGPTPANLKPCAILIDKDELLNLERSGKFDFKSEPCDNDDVENSTSDLQEDEELDELLFEVAQWGIAENGISIAKVQRHFCLGFGRAGKIVDQLCSLGICGSSTDDMELHPMLVGMDELLLLERSGRFG